MTPNLDELYAVLLQWVAGGGPRTYADLSHDYQSRTGHWFEPHGSWDRPLGALNERLATMGAPALSALVFLKGQNEPGGGFWGCAPNVPPRPRDDLSRLTELDLIVKSVLAYAWPPSLPL